MIDHKNIEKIKNAVHRPLNWEDYNSTSVVEDTNCFSHAIGSTVTSDITAYRLGRLSDKKGLGKEYFSKEEVKNLFREDLSVIDLEAKEIPFENLRLFLEKLSEMKFADNEHVVALFVRTYGRDEKIMDFHFLRYDKEKGWSEKRWNRKVHFIENILIGWPSSWNDKLIGVFKITR